MKHPILCKATSLLCAIGTLPRSIGLAFLMVVLGSCQVTLAHAEDFIVSCDVLEDPSDQLTITDVAHQPFQALSRCALAEGYSASAFWLKLQVRAPDDPNGELVLRMRPSFIDEIRLYEASDAPPEQWKTRITGDRYPYAERDFASISPNFTVKPAPPGTIHYLRLKSTSASLLHVEAMSFYDAQDRDLWLDFVNGILLAGVLWSLAWAVHDYFDSGRPKVVGLFALHQIVYVFIGLAVPGYLPILVPAEFPALADQMTSILVCAVTFSGLLFSRELFKSYDPPPLLMAGLTLMLLSFPLELSGMALGLTREALHINAILMIFSRWCCAFTAFFLRRESVPSRRLVQAVHIVLAVCVSAVMGSNFGWKPTLWSTYYLPSLVMIAYGLLGSLLFVLLLHARSRQLQAEARQHEIDLALSLEALKLEQTLREEAETRAQTDFLTGLHNRRHFVALAERELARVARYPQALSLLMIDIDHFKAVNDTRGHSVGDQALQQVTSLIKNSLRQVDIVGRMGGEEFAVLLLEVDGEHALELAEHLRKTIASTLIFPPEGQPLRVTVSIGLTELRGRAVSLDGLLKEADDALYQAKNSGRNRVLTSPASTGVTQ